MSAAAAPVIFAPLPPAPSGIADYTAELLPMLGPDITVVAQRGAAPIAGATVIDEGAYLRRPELYPRPHLLMLGNSVDSAHSYRAALRRPAVVLLHDPVLHHLVEALTLGGGRPHAYAAALRAEYGPAGERLARLRAAGLFSDWQRWLLPLHRAPLLGARGVLVHSRYAAARLPTDLDAPVRVLPHHASPRCADYDGVSQAQARAELGLPQAGPILLCAGHLTPPKRIDAVMAAHASLPGSTLVLAGAAAVPIAARPGVIVTGPLPERAFFLHLRAADLLIALRFPTGGESSGTLARALGMGLPAVVDAYGPAAEYPDAAVFKLPFARDAAAPLADLLRAALADGTGLAARGRAARAHADAHMRAADSAAAIRAALAEWG